MNPAFDTADDNGGDFDPQQAAALLDQATQQARRQLEPSPPWLLAVRAVLALAGYGAIWLSVRGQHPYLHPTSALIPVGIGIGVVNVIAVTVVGKRATAGVAGRTRFRPAEIAAATAVWVAVFVVMGVMAGAGVSNRIVYGLYPAAAPLIVAGLIWAAMMAARRNWRQGFTSLAAAVVGAVSLLAGPAGAWAVCGVGLFVLLLASVAVTAWRQRAR
jgi:hypothetical protein